MNLSLTLSVFLMLVVVEGSLCVDISVTGNEGAEVQIKCPYSQGYEECGKYFYKGVYKDSVTILSSGEKTVNDRFSMQDDKKTRTFTVTIRNLIMADAGPYGCEAWCMMSRYFNQVLLKVNKVLFISAPRKQTPSPSPSIDTTTDCTSTVSHQTGSERTSRGNTAGPLSQDSDFTSITVGLVVVLLVLCSGSFLLLKMKRKTFRTALHQQSEHQNIENDRMYEEMPESHPASPDVTTMLSNQMSASHLTNIPTTLSVYARVTNQQSDLKLSHTHSANQSFRYFKRNKEELNVQIPEKMIEYERRMKMMLTFTLLMIPGALSFSVTGYTGGAVTITCPYDRGYTRNEKYFCKGQKPVIPRPGWCSDVIRTDVKDEWVESERFSLYDDTTASVFNVTITDLNEHDSDTYQCAVDIDYRKDIYTEVKLTVREGALSFSVTGYTGGAVTITCPYDRGYTSNEKYFCKGQKPVIPRRGWCSDLIRTDVKDKWVKSERFSLYDDTTTSVFTVTITDLNEDDSDTYQCVVDIVGWTDIYTEVKLTVREGALSFSVMGYTGGAVTITCPYDRGYTSNAKYFCKDSLLIMSLSVVLVLIITGLLMLTVILWKRHQTAVTRSHAGPVNKEQISRASCDYTEIKDIRRDEVCTTDSPNTLYATAQLPTIPSDSPNTVYATAQLPTIPSDSANIVYAEVKQP
ncbi:putative CMRF35-like molecule 8 [Triplophysa rosa]|uniref:CMRF35-like molecule 8 n=1 Tax=Triplophysa rosa TaxID=992332 RepID=A0A9W7WYM5_TRIRA|nr:putative CMRF35-like molecule 8 [Triplophysa rosa]